MIETTETVRECSSDVPNFSEFDYSALRAYDRKLDFSRFAFVQPDGSPIAVSYPGKDRAKKRVYMDRRYHSFVPYGHPFKRENPTRVPEILQAKLELWSAKYQKQYVICFDFDAILWHERRQSYKWGSDLSSNYDHDVDHLKLGYTVLAQKLQERIGNKGYVFNSPKSGRPKILLVIEYEDAVRTPRHRDLVDLANEIFPEYVAEDCIDMEKSAFSSTYIPWDKRHEIRDRVPLLEPILITRSAENVTFKTSKERMVVASTFTYLAIDKLPEHLDSEEFSESFRHFLRVLCTMSALIKGGFGISQKILARTLGVSQQTASNYIQRVISMGLLSVHNDKYEPNKRAKVYKARGALRKYIKRKVNSVLPTVLPRRIRRGHWHATALYYGVKCFRTSPDGFLKWFKNIRGHDEGDRMEQAIGIYNLLRRINKLPPKKF